MHRYCPREGKSESAFFVLSRRFASNDVAIATSVSIYCTNNWKKENQEPKLPITQFARRKLKTGRLAPLRVPPTLRHPEAKKLRVLFRKHSILNPWQTPF